MRPLIDVLKELDGSATSREATDAVIEKCKISEEKQEEILKGGTPRVKNDIGWARYYLVEAGLVDSSRRGIWALTQEGLDSDLSEEEACGIFKDVLKRYVKRKKEKEGSETAVDTEAENEEETETIAPANSEATSSNEPYRSELLEILKSLSPEGFERFSAYLLRLSEFDDVVVTGRSNDGGIDGHGTLRVNSFGNRSRLGEE